MLYNTQHIGLLDRLIPVCELTTRPHNSDQWFDNECRVATRRIRTSICCCQLSDCQCQRLKFFYGWDAEHHHRLRRCSKSGEVKLSHDNHCAIRRQKCDKFWSGRIEADQSDLRKVWRTVNPVLLATSHRWHNERSLMTSGQIFGSKFNTDVDPRTDRRCDRAVCHCSLQSITGCWPFCCQFQGVVSHPYREESTSLIITTNFECFIACLLWDNLTSDDLLQWLMQSSFGSVIWLKLLSCGCWPL